MFIVSERRRLFDILTKERAEVLDDLLGRLVEPTRDAELDEGRNCNGRAGLELDVLVALRLYVSTYIDRI